MEYKINRKDRLRLVGLGLVFYAVGAIWMGKLAFADDDLSAVTLMLMLYMCLYGAFVLAKPFFSILIADDRGFTVRVGMQPKRRVQYADVAMCIFDKITMRLVLHFEDGNKFGFEYIFDDINGFIKRLSQNGIEVQKVRSNPV